MGESKEFKTIFICPHCQNEVKATVTFSADGLFVDRLPKYALPRSERFSTEECDFLEQADKAGISAAFKSAVSRIKQTQTPKDLDKFFLAFVRTAQKKTVPEIYLARLQQLFPDSLIGVYGTQQILMVTANKTPRLFLPDAFTLNERGLKAFEISDATEQLDQWTRTKYGYVADKGIVFEIFKAKNAGEFARPVL